MPTLRWLSLFLAATLVACESDTPTDPPGDTTAPSVASTDPAESTEEVPRDGVVTVTFSEEVDPDTVTEETFRMIEAPSELPVEGSVRVEGATATFTPDADLGSRATYVAILTTGITDLAGNPLASQVSWGFTTELELGIELVRVRISQMDGSEPGSIDSDSHPGLFQLDGRIDRVVLEFFNDQSKEPKRDTTPVSWRVPLTPNIAPADSAGGFISLRIIPIVPTSLDFGSIEFTTSAATPNEPSGLRLVVSGPPGARTFDGMPFFPVPTDQERDFLVELDVGSTPFNTQFRWTASDDNGENGGGHVGFSTRDLVIRADPE